MPRLRDGSTVDDPRLGRLVQFDERSRSFPLTAHPRLATQLATKTWRLPVRLDQKQTPDCTGFSRAHDLAASPAPARGMTAAVARQIYDLAQTLDEWEGTDYDGSSVLGAVKAAVQLGYVGEYRWAGVNPSTSAIDDVLRALSSLGPVVLGINWLEGMFEPRWDGTLDCSGEASGGHAIVARSVLLPRSGRIRVTRSFAGHGRTVGFAATEPYVALANSWGPDWGVLGECFVAASDLDARLRDEGEGCVTTSAFAKPRA